MQKFTIFCQESDGTGTIWIDSVEALDLAAAKVAGRAACAADWEFEPEDVHVLGVAAGDVKILAWEDVDG